MTSSTKRDDQNHIYAAESHAVRRLIERYAVPDRFKARELYRLHMTVFLDRKRPGWTVEKAWHWKEGIVWAFTGPDGRCFFAAVKVIATKPVIATYMTPAMVERSRANDFHKRPKHLRPFRAEPDDDLPASQRVKLKRRQHAVVHQFPDWS